MKRKVPEFARNFEALGKIIGRSAMAVSRYKAIGAPLRREARGYRVAPFLDWLRRSGYLDDGGAAAPAGKRPGRANFPAAAPPATPKEQLLLAQVKERKAKAAQAALALKLARARLVPLERVQERDLRRIAVVKQGLWDFCRRLAPELAALDDPRAVEEVLQREVRRLLERFSEEEAAGSVPAAPAGAGSAS